MSDNPFVINPHGDQMLPQPPAWEPPPPTYEITREGGLKHEYSIRSVGILYYLAGFLMGIAGIMMMVGPALGGSRTGSSVEEMLILGAVYLGFSVLYFGLGYGLRRVKPWVRIPVAILSGLSLLSIPIGTLIGGYILWLVGGKMGKHIFSEEYQEAIRQTPHMKYKPKTSPIAIAILVLLLILIGVAAFFAISSL